MSKVRIFAHSNPKIGYVARTITLGEEFNMVQSYIDFIYNKAAKYRQKQIAIFIEPQLETGYPDLVIIEYSISKSDVWNTNRLQLTPADLKILFQIQEERVISRLSLHNLLGFSVEQIEKSLTKLDSCGLIRYAERSEQVRSVKLKNYFRINKIISIEAKLDKWADAIRQADYNIWFSTESYILMNKKNCNNSILQQCKSKGIGIILVNGRVEKILSSNVREIPVSYASLQFNEWLQKSLNYEEE